MRKDIALPTLALVGGVAGFLLRLWQRTTALDPATGIFEPHSPATLGLLALVLGMAVLALILSRGVRPISNPEQAFHCSATLYMTLMVSAAMLFLFAGALGVPQFMQELQAWQYEPKLNPLPISLGLLLIGCLAAAAGALISGRNNYRGTTGPQIRSWTTFPAYAALVWLIFTYQSYSRDPILLNVFIPILACIFLLLALYQQSAFAYGLPRPSRFLFCSMMGIVLGITSAADPQPRFSLLLTAAFVLCSFAGLMALSRRAFGPALPHAAEEGERMPAGAEDPIQTDTSNE